MPGRRTRSPSPEYSRKRSKHATYSSKDSPSPTRKPSTKPSERDRDRDSNRDRDYRDRRRDRSRDRRDRSRDRYRDRSRDRNYRDRSPRRDRDRDSHKDRDKEKDRARDRSKDRHRDGDRGKDPQPKAREAEKSLTANGGHNGSSNGTRHDTMDVDGPVPPSKSGSGNATTSAKPPALSEEEIKQREKKERLEAWKRDREAKKALNDATAKAMALAGKVSASISLPPSLPAKPLGGTLNRNALGGLGLKGLPVKADLQKPKQSKIVGAVMDDFTESKRKLEVLGDMPAVDMTMDVGGESVGDNLEAADDDDEIVLDKPVVQIIEEEEEEDPLEAFMSGVNEQVKRTSASDGKTGRLGARIDEQDRVAEDGGDEQQTTDDIDATGLDTADILALAAKKVKKKDLAVVDHVKVDYEPFRRAFYHPVPEIAEMTEEDATSLRHALDDIRIKGLDCPKPVPKWSQCGLPANCLEVIKKLGYTAPTSIQAQAIPAIMSGRDVIGVAKTGSGKTIAFLLPLFRQIKDQRPLESMEGPMAIVMTPTRELAVQIHRECKPFLKVLNLRAVCAYGGSPIKDQIAEMKKGTEIVVCTPGRMIDLLTANSGRVTNLRRVTYLVLDEADRMFDMGFEPQVMKIINNIRPDRQTVLFSATFPKQMDSLARKILQRPLEITVGGKSVVASEITQLVEVRAEDTKFTRLLQILGDQTNADADARILIFVERQEAADNLLRDLLRRGYPCMSLHGGKDQVDRDQTIADFKSGVTAILIATSVAARGLDVKQLKVVINFDPPNHMEDYVHRAGRAGRAGQKGTCITFITPEQEKYSVDLYRALKASNAEIPPELATLSEGFIEKVKAGNAKQAGSGFGGKGLDKLDKDRDAKEKAQRTAYGEEDEGKEEKAEAATTTTTAATEKEIKDEGMTIGDMKIEIRRGPAPDTSRAGGMLFRAKEDIMQSQIKAMEEEAARQDKNGADYKKAMSVIAKLNAQLRATKLMTTHGGQLDDRKKDPDATDYHAIIPINDYPQKARWRVTNKETMSALVEATGASVTNKGIYYETGKDVPNDGPPKLHLLIESNDEFRVENAVREIKRLLVEASAAALQAESRGTTGRYNVV